jgi:hypothetical protein
MRTLLCEVVNDFAKRCQGPIDLLRLLQSLSNEAALADLLASSEIHERQLAHALCAFNPALLHMQDKDGMGARGVCI